MIMSKYKEIKDAYRKGLIRFEKGYRYEILNWLPFQYLYSTKHLIENNK